MPSNHFSPDIRLADIAALGGFKMQGAADEDFAGFNFGWADINGDGLSDLIVCADGYDGGGLLAGGAFVIYGKRDGITPFIDFANLARSDGFVIQGEFAFDLASRSVAGAGDVNGDGIADMFIGAFKNDEGGYDSGAAYIIYGRTEPFPSVVDLYDLPDDLGIKIVGEASEDYASLWVASAGDVNGDGRADLIMGAPQNDAGGPEAGAAYVIFGRDTNFTGKISLANMDPAVGFKISGASASDFAGFAVGSADINGDELTDLIVGAPQTATTGPGSAYVIYGRADIGAVDLAQLTSTQGFVIRGEAIGDLAGFNVAGAGDVNGDGIADLVIGATQHDAGGSNAGAAYVIFGNAAGFAGGLDLNALDGDNGFKLQGAAAGDETGVCVSTAGDVNGDGYDDILVGAQFSSVDGVISGAAYLLFGKAGGFAPVIDLARLDPRDGIRIRGEGAGDTTGRALSAAGDMNGDGYDDIAIGSPWNGAAGFKAGAAYVIYGRPDNRAPTAVDTRVSGTEDIPYVFGLADFGFADTDGDALAEVWIATLATRGTLILQGQDGTSRAVMAGQAIAAADVAAGRLFFAGEADASGIGYASFTFGVRDGGGTVASGRDASLADATLFIDLAADTSDAADVIYGTPGNDTLVASGEQALLIGLGGDDTYFVGSQAHAVVEAVGEGADTVRTSVDYVLADGAEIEVLEAADPAGFSSLRLTGNEFNTIVRGNAGANSLYGAGGENLLEGRGGNDSYLVSTSADRVIEVGGEGYDTVYALANYRLTAGAEIEVLLCYDRAATFAQDLTGNEADTLILGSNGANVIIGGGGRDTMYGYRGTDTFYVDSSDDLPVELAGEGYDTIVTSVSYVMPQGMEFEILRPIDSAATTVINLTGNKIPNIIIGNAGSNVIDGLGGGDDMRGLGGDDTYIIRKFNDRVEEAIGGGHDIVRTLVNYSLSPDAEIERLEAYAATERAALTLTGNRFANVISGGAGANVLDGGGGGDDMEGLGGNDTFIVRDTGDRVREAADGGVDTIRTLVDYTLAANAEIERLEAHDPRDTATLRLIGNGFTATIVGNAGANVLNGGRGEDVLHGLGGSDSYIIEDGRNRVVEAAGEGDDTVYTQTDYILEADSEVEVLTAYDRETTAPLWLTGNAFDQTIYGNAGANVLTGGGGADTLYGIEGDDIYIVDSPDDRILEASGGGYDTVRALVSYTLDRTAEVEVLRALDPNSTVGLRLAGNTFDQAIYGTAGNDSILGILGADVLNGLVGNDSYVVQDARAVVIEAAEEGYDTVYTTVSYRLSAGGHVEVLTVYDRATVDSIDLIGNAFANTIYGNDGGNRIDGGGGRDILYGMGGADTFVFATPFGTAGVNRIVDFQSGLDGIELASDLFAGIATGVLDRSQFVAGTVAQDVNDRIIYDRATGALFYDPDGTGAEAAVQFAALTPDTILTAGDIVVV